MYLSDLIGGKSETDLEKAVDRFFLNQSIAGVAGRLFDPDRRKRQLEEKMLEQSLTTDSFEDKISTGINVASWLRKPARSGLATLLMR